MKCSYFAFIELLRMSIPHHFLKINCSKNCIAKASVPDPDVFLQVLVTTVKALLGLGDLGHCISNFNGRSPHHGVEQLTLSFRRHTFCGEINPVCVSRSGLVQAES